MPNLGSTFRTDEPFLHKILEEVGDGMMQLPDFQRGWVWDDEHIRSLIASVSLSYPIGAIMTLETGGDGGRFAPKAVQGTSFPAGKLPEKLILDGQQRLTSLYLAFCSGKPVPTQTEKGDKIQRYYYLHMESCLDPDADRLDAVVSVPADRVARGVFAREVVLDVSTREKEYELGLFPVELIFDAMAYDEWKEGFQEQFDHSKEKNRFLNQFSRDVWQPLQQYKVPVIVLLRGTEKEAVCQVFEKVNTGGVTLTVFELVTATFAADDFRLRMDWEKREERLRKHAILEGTDGTAFLTSVTLLATYHRYLDSPETERRPAVGCKRRDVLRLSLDDYKKYADRIEAGFEAAVRLLTREKIFDARSLPYTTQLIPMAAILAHLGDRFESEPIKQRILRWYWCGVFGELYGGANEFRFSLDLPEMIAWIDGGPEPRTVQDANFAPTRLLTLQTRNSAAYKGLIVRLMQDGSKDFLNGDPIEITSYFDLAVDIHHIFPRKWCTDREVNRNQWNCVVNKAPLSARTNRVLGGWAPSQYLANLTRTHNVTEPMQDGILRSHRINPNLLRADDFPGFLRHRAAELLDIIQAATGKTVSGRDSDEVAEAFGGSLVPGAGTRL